MTASIAGLDRIAIDIAPGSGPSDDPSTFAWESAGSRRTSADIVITAGRDDEASAVEPGSMSALMDDRAGNLSPRNVVGQWYGAIGRGTPVQVQWDRTSDDFTRTAVAGGWGTNTDGFAWLVSNPTYMSTDGTRAISTLPFNNASRNRLSGAGSPDVEIVWSFSVPVMPTGGAAIVSGLLRDTSSTDSILVNAELHPDGTVATRIYRRTSAGFVVLHDTLSVTTAGIDTKIWAKARAEGASIMVKLWTGTRGDEPADWDATTEDDVCEGTGTGLFPWRLNTDVGTFTVYIDDFELTNILWVGSVPEWAPRWPDKSGQDAVAPITAAGVLRQLTTDTGIVQSPLRRQLGTLSYTTAYLPFEDESSATRAGSGISGGRVGAVSGGTFAADDTLPGSAPTLVLDTAGVSTAFVNTIGGNTTGYAAMVLFKCGSAVAAERTLLSIRATGTVTRWEVYVNGSSYGFRGFAEDGTLVADSVATHGGAPPTGWTAIQLETEVSGGTVTVTLLWHAVGSNTYLFTNDTYSGTAPRITGVGVSAVTDATSVAHLWAGDDALPFVDPNFRMASNGYIGEEAAARVERLCTEAGIPVAVLAGDSEPMGAQRPATLIDLLRECEDADLGVLYERATSLGYRPRRSRYRPVVSLALDWSLGHLDEPPQPIDDDQRLYNIVRVNRTGGSYATAQDDTSISAEGPHPLQHDANISSDDRLDDFAAWLLSQGTDDQMRWPRIKINLVAHPELIPSWLACNVGSRVTISNAPIPGIVVDLTIEGFTQTINVDRWTVEMSCSPASWWHIGRYDDPEGISKYQLRSGTTAAEYAAAATSITVHTTEDLETLSQVSAYDIMIAGERIGVPIAGAAARTGSTGNWDTVLTGLTRAKNGVSKILPAGSPVTIADKGRYAL